MKKPHTRTRGMTMIELVVAFALSSIFFAVLIAVVSPVYRTYQRTRDMTDAELIAGNVIDTIRTSADRAVTLTTSGSGDGTEVCVGIIKYYADDGVLMYVELDATGATVGEPKPVFDEKFYNGKQISLLAEEISANTLRVTATVTTMEETSATQTGVISTLRQYVQGEVTTGGDGTTGSGGAGMKDDDHHTDWAKELKEALKRINKKTDMNVDSATPTLTANQIIKSETGNWTPRVLIELAKMLDLEAETEEAARAALSAVNIQTWAIRSNGANNCVFLSGVNIQNLQPGTYVPVICLDLKAAAQQAFKIGYAKVYEQTKLGKMTLNGEPFGPYKTLGTRTNAWQNDFIGYVPSGGAATYLDLELARKAYNMMPLVKP